MTVIYCYHNTKIKVKKGTVLGEKLRCFWDNNVFKYNFTSNEYFFVSEHTLYTFALFLNDEYLKCKLREQMSGRG